VWWWLKSPSYTGFVLRELTSVFVALFALVVLWQVRALGQGPLEYARFLERLRSPAFIAFHALALLFVLFHSITWFNLAPKAMVVRFGGRRLPDLAVAGLNYGAWLVLSGAVAFILLRR
jgi:fumarate reductase subunit C